MKAIKKWAEGRPIFVEHIAIHAATGAHDFSHGFKNIKSRKFLKHQFSLPNLPSWFQLYQDQQVINGFLRSLFTKFLPLTDDQIELGEGMVDVFANGDKIDLSTLKNITQDDIDQAMEDIRGFIDISYKEIENDLNPEPIDPDEQKAFMEFLGTNELQAAFFLLVHFPCWILYQTSPQRLYYKATSGDIDSLEMLLRLDALMIHDPSIGQQVQNFRFNHKTSVYSDLMDATLRRPKRKITRKRIKYLVAGFISVMSEACGHPLNEAEISSLFNAIAKDAGRGYQDEDLPGTPDAFSKAIRRNRGCWLDIIKPDSKI